MTAFLGMLELRFERCFNVALPRSEEKSLRQKTVNWSSTTLANRGPARVAGFGPRRSGFLSVLRLYHQCPTRELRSACQMCFGECSVKTEPWLMLCRG